MLVIVQEGIRDYAIVDALTGGVLVYDGEWCRHLTRW